MRVSALLSLLNVPLSNADLLLLWNSVYVVVLDPVGFHAYDVVIVQQNVFFRVFQERRNVASDEILVLADTYYQRGLLTGRINPVREITENDPQRIASLEFLQRFSDGAERVPLGIVIVQQACDYLGIRLGSEGVSLFGQKLLEFYVVLDYSVVYDRDPSVCVRV